MLALSVYELNVFAKKGTLEDASNLQMAESLFQKPFPPAILPTPHEHEKSKSIFLSFEVPSWLGFAMPS